MWNLGICGILLGEAKHNLPTGVLTKLRETGSRDRAPLNNKARTPEGIEPFKHEYYYMKIIILFFPFKKTRPFIICLFLLWLHLTVSFDF